MCNPLARSAGVFLRNREKVAGVAGHRTHKANPLLLLSRCFSALVCVTLLREAPVYFKDFEDFEEFEDFEDFEDFQF